MAELVKAFLQESGRIVQKSPPMETLRVPYSPTYNTMFVLKRFQSPDDLFDEVAAMEHARSSFNKWMPGCHIVPYLYLNSELSNLIAMEHIPGKNGSEVDMGFWTRRQRRHFVRQMAVIEICLFWGARDRTSETSTQAMVPRGLRHKSATVYDREVIGEPFIDALSGISAPPRLLKNFRFIRPCDISLRGSKIVAITGWGPIVNGRGGQGTGVLSGLGVLLDDTAPPGYEALEDPNSAIIRAYGGRIREGDFVEMRFDSERDECDGEREGEELVEGWYHGPVWQLISEYVYRCEIRSKAVPIGGYLGLMKRGSGGSSPESESGDGYGQR